MWLKGESNLEACVPELDSSVPSSADKVGLYVQFVVFQNWAIPNAADPIGVVVALSCELAVSQDVP